MTLTVYDVPADVSSTITPGGDAASVDTGVRGEGTSLPFPGSAGQRISLKVSAVTMTQAKLSIIGPSGTLVAPTLMTTAGGFVDTKTLPASGTYTIVVDPQGTCTGSMTLTLFDVPADVSSTITPGGAAASVATTVPGQGASLTFTGSAGQRISLTVATTITQAKLSITRPDGANLVAPLTVSPPGTFVDTKTLPLSGTYTIVVDPQSKYTGSMTLTLYEVPPDV